ncbi:Putative thiamine pyrophosphate-containing protein YdaP [Aquisphaera giovannonii]|uniref:Thiamine pyrophosphate-containing protein YdaP n=1 Tax=Aquisphaera giovannonii TaxID=406548 RepID=A0A5B9WBN4_9BACT|nr:thiamine pyrophosphate-dependent enzyme [Aquisphaera giovannonii]QEH38016.1 Putative thiamine pyrophosphate-containing protein YdaP [Aquisphaera giovannonii]
MADTTADVLFDRLIDWGVDTIFGLPGDGINGFMEALRTRREKIRFIQVRHEEGAAFAACGYAKFTGRLGVCIATSGPGAIHLLNGLYDAKMDGAPVLAITGQTYHDLMGMHYQQEVNLLGLFTDVAVFNEQINGPRHARSLADVACRTALARRGVAHLNCPNDWQERTEVDASAMNVKGHTSAAWRPPIVIPQEESLRSAAAILNAGTRTVLLVGQGALGAGDEVEKIADLLGAPVVKALLGKAVIPDDSPFCTGGLGLLGTLPSEKAMEECDSLLMVGTSFPYMAYLPDPGQAKAVQVDCDGTRLGLRYPIDVGLVGDAKATLQALIPLLQKRADRSFLEKAQVRVKDWWELMKTREDRTEVPLKPQVIAGHVNELLADNAIITTDSGTITTWAARHLKIRRGMKFSCSGNLATMAVGLPYANGAQVAFPDRQVVAFVGDGGFSMLMPEFITAVKHQLPIKVIIIKNNTLGQIKWEQMVFLGNPEYGVELQPIDFVRFAEACGGVGFHCEKPEEVRPALEMAFKSNKPAVVEAVVDPFEPPMPAQASPKQAVNFAKSLAKGEPNRVRIATTIFRDKVTEFFQ